MEFFESMYLDLLDKYDWNSNMRIL